MRKSPVLLLSLALSMMEGFAIRAEEQNAPAPNGAVNQALAQSTPQVRSRGRQQANVYKSKIVPHWSEDNTHFWYRNELPDNKREYIFVNAIQGERRRAFDHHRLAKALQKAGVKNVQADRLHLERLTMDTKTNQFRFHLNGADWKCDLQSFEVVPAEKGEGKPQADLSAIHPQEAPRSSQRTGPETELRFVNESNQTVEIFWLDGNGKRHSYGKIEAGAARNQHTFAGHLWMVTDENGKDLASFEASEHPRDALITGKPIPRKPRNRPVRRANRDTSPNGVWRVFIRNHNIVVSNNQSKQEWQLTEEGRPDQSFEMLQWSPDSRAFLAFQVEPGEQKEVYLVESSPPTGGRAVLHRRPYALPGDRFPAYKLKLFRWASPDQKADEPKSPWQEIETRLDPIDFGRPQVRWNAEGNKFTYVKIDRGHQRYRVIEVNAHTGQSRHLIDEQTDTFIWTAHPQHLGVGLVTWLEKTKEIIYASEVDGWRHLYLIDPQKPAEDSENTPQIHKGGKTFFAAGFKNQITQGEFIIRGVDRIDEEQRQIWFRASGLNPGQDPYFIHYCRVNFDGTGFVQLTEGNGDHTVQFSPDRRFLIDTYSRVDLPPAHELRRMDNGSLVCTLESADITELTESGWKPPEVFTAKGRDGITDIWGMICRPPHFDPARKYPVIEAIYAGPHSSFVPKSFSKQRHYASLTDLGFIVVKIDGMGTANRSKAFHDVCWHNLKDAGLPDRILWMKAAAKNDPAMDLNRVGIYGGSAGGQNAAGALLFHPDFYKVAVAGCGCHDNRMDKASWNEQWMGYPVGKHYAESSNIDNARRLKGKLMLIVGEMDQNVPPESTLRFADALIRADKNFDLLVIPGAGHGMGGAYGDRRMHEFFVEHLIHKQPSP